MSKVNVMWERVRTILNDGINKYFYLFVCFMAFVWELNCQTV
jgi:hypothetical protein